MTGRFGSIGYGWRALGALIALPAILLSFANASAANGLVIAPFKALGAPFFAADTVAYGVAGRYVAARQQELLDVAGLEQEGERQQQPTRSTLMESALGMLGHDSFAALGPTLASFAALDAGQEVQAERLIKRSLALSRRERLARFWLMREALLAGEFDDSLAQVDILLRSLGDPPPELFQQFSPLLLLPEGRESLGRIAERNPNWVVALYETLTTDAREAAPVADLMLRHQGLHRDTPRARAVYASLVKRLADEGAARQLKMLYPRLPGADADALQRISFAVYGNSGGYPPVIWSLQDETEAGASIFAASNVADGVLLSAFANPGRSAIVARKVVAVAPNASIGLTVGRISEAPNASAYIEATCLDGEGIQTKSSNLLSAAGTRVRMRLPDRCDLVLVEVTLNGGDGMEPLEIELHGLRLE